MAERRCGNCRYFFPLLEAALPRGGCRKLPPVVFVGTNAAGPLPFPVVTQFPEVPESWWCGAHQEGSPCARCQRARRFNEKWGRMEDSELYCPECAAATARDTAAPA